MTRTIIKLCFISVIAFWLLLTSTLTYIIIDKIEQCEANINHEQKCKLIAMPENLMEYHP